LEGQVSLPLFGGVSTKSLTEDDVHDALNPRRPKGLSPTLISPNPKQVSITKQKGNRRAFPEDFGFCHHKDGGGGGGAKPSDSKVSSSSTTSGSSFYEKYKFLEC